MLRCLTALAIVLPIFGCAGDPSEPTSTDLAEVPQPDLGPLEDAVREQIVAGRQALDDAIEAGGDDRGSLADSYGEQGKLYHAYKILAPAEACYLNAQRLDPDDPRWPYYRAHLRLEDDDTEGAVLAFRRVLELAPGDPPALLHLARTYQERGEPERAEPLLERILARDPASAPALAVLGKIAAERGDPEAAVRHLESALRSDPQATDLHYPLGLAYRDLGDLERARHLLERRGGGKVEVDDPLLDELDALAGGMRLHQNRGSEAFLRGNFAEAAEHYRQAVEAEPESALAHANLASALTRLGRLDEAKSHYQQALQIETVHADANRNYGTLLARLGDDESAIVHYRRALAVDPGNGDGHFNLANALRRLDRFDEALPHYRQAVEIDPRRAEAHLALALTLIRLEHWRDAVDAVTAARAIFPDLPLLTQTEARLLATAPVDALRDGERAHQLATELLAVETSLDHVETAAMALAELGRFAQAAVYQRQAIDAARGAQRPDLVARLSANLERYAASRPCRQPWPPDDPMLSPGSRAQ